MERFQVLLRHIHCAFLRWVLDVSTVFSLRWVLDVSLSHVKGHEIKSSIFYFPPKYSSFPKVEVWNCIGWVSVDETLQFAWYFFLLNISTPLKNHVELNNMKVCKMIFLFQKKGSYLASIRVDRVVISLSIQCRYGVEFVVPPHVPTSCSSKMLHSPVPCKVGWWQNKIHLDITRV